MAEPFVRVHPLEIFTGATREAGHAGVHLPSQLLGGRGGRVRSSQTELGHEGNRERSFGW